MSVELGHRPFGLFSVMVDPSSSSRTVPLGPKTSRENFRSEELRTRRVPDYSDYSRAESGSEQGISSSRFSQPLREQVVSSPCSSWRGQGIPEVGEGTRPRAHNEEPENSQDFAFKASGLPFHLLSTPCPPSILHLGKLRTQTERFPFPKITCQGEADEG